MTVTLDDLYHAVDRPTRILTAVAAYDGHDASILAINRSLRECGYPVEVIYMGYNKKVGEIVKAAVEEGVDCVAVSSYNGGHNHFFPALVNGLRKAGSHAIVGGGAGGPSVRMTRGSSRRAGWQRSTGSNGPWTDWRRTWWSGPGPSGRRFPWKRSWRMLPKERDQP